MVLLQQAYMADTSFMFAIRCTDYIISEAKFLSNFIRPKQTWSGVKILAPAIKLKFDSQYKKNRELPYGHTAPSCHPERNLKLCEKYPMQL